MWHNINYNIVVLYTHRYYHSLLRNKIYNLLIISSISLISHCRPVNSGSGSWRGTSKNNGLRVNCGDLYWANLILGSTGPFTVPVLADLLIQVLRDRNILRSSTAFGCVAKK